MENNQISNYNNQIIINDQIRMLKEDNGESKSFGYWLLKFGIYLIFGIWLLVILLLSGCANVVTSKTLSGQELRLEITLAGEPDTFSKTYAVVFGSSALPVPYAGHYFFLPGDNYEQDLIHREGLDYYYSGYFSGWMDFITLENENFYLHNGSFTLSANHLTYQSVLLAPRALSSEDPNAEKKITLNFDLSRLTSVPVNLYFNVITIDASGVAADTISGNNYISTVAGTSISATADMADGVLDPSLDIVSWSAVVL